MKTPRSTRMHRQIRQRRQQIGRKHGNPAAPLDSKKFRRIVAELRFIVEKQARQIKEEKNLLDNMCSLLKAGRNIGKI